MWVQQHKRWGETLSERAGLRYEGCWADTICNISPRLMIYGGLTAFAPQRGATHNACADMYHASRPCMLEEQDVLSPVLLRATLLSEPTHTRA